MQDRSPTGIRQSKRQVYHLNFPNSTGTNSGDLYVKNLNETIGIALTSSIQNKSTWDNAFVEGAPYNQNATNSFLKVYHWQNDKGASNEELEGLATKDDKNNPIGFEVKHLALDDQGWSLIINGKAGEANNKLFEIRDQDMIIDYMVEAGFGDKVVLQMTNQLMRGFQAGSPDYYAGQTMEPGQSRSNITTSVTDLIGNGMFTRPVTRLLKSEKDTATGNIYPEGTMKYYSLSDKK